MIFSCVFSNSKKMYLCAVVRTEARGADASKRRAYADGFAGGRQTYKKALSQRLICGVSNLANSKSPQDKAMVNVHGSVYSCRGESLFAPTVRISKQSVSNIHTAWASALLILGQRQCESLIRGMSDEFRFPRFFCGTMPCLGIGGEKDK